MLTGQAKRDYQREWVRQKRARGSTQGSTDGFDKPVIGFDKDVTRTNQGLTARLEAQGLMIDTIKLADKTPQIQLEGVTEHIEYYVPGLYYEPGTKLKIKQGRRETVFTVPELDASGNPIYEEG